MNFREYRGIRSIVIAEITKDDSTTYETSEWRVLSGVQAVSKATNESSETHYYDNQGVIIIDTEGNDEYTLTLSVLDKETKALIEGTTYKNGVLVGTPKTKKYFALGFIGMDTDGVEEFNIIYKGKFSGGDETYNTKNDGADATGVEYTFTSVYTAYKDTIDGVKKSFKLAQAEATTKITETAVFGNFTGDVSDGTALKPSELITLGAAA